MRGRIVHPLALTNEASEEIKTGNESDQHVSDQDERKGLK